MTSKSSPNDGASTRKVHFLPAIKRSLAGVPAGMAAALVIFVTGYWGLHIAFYGLEGRAVAMPTEMATHTYSPEHSHGPMALESVVAGELDGGRDVSHAVPHGATAAGSATAAYEATMTAIHGPMMEGIQHPDPDVAFVLGMIPHHQGAIDMAKVQMQFGKDPANKALAEHILQEQQQEIDAMTEWLQRRGVEVPGQ